VAEPIRQPAWYLVVPNRSHLAVAASILLAGCTDPPTSPDSTEGDATGTTDATGDIADTTAPPGDDTVADASDGPGQDEDSGDDATGHALGTVVLAEAHVAGGGLATGAVQVAFIPDASSVVAACTETIAGCRIARAPQCESGCGEDQYCGFDPTCHSACVDVCDAQCEQGEECYFAAPGLSACRERDVFDAGAVSFSGTTTPITLFPPYVAEPLENGAPFAAGTVVTVEASGATNAGFDAFGESYTTTTFVQTQLAEIGVDEAFGDDDIAVRWSAGRDDIAIAITATASDRGSGTVTCDADDATGAFDVPRAAVLAALGDRPASTLSITVTRSRTEVVEGLATKGMLANAEVQAEGWLELTSRSSESWELGECERGEPGCVEVPDCHPLAQDCPDGQGCYPTSEGVSCAVDASGELGEFGDACRHANACDPGLWCADAANFDDCGGVGCCSTFCDLSSPSCEGTGQECVPFYEVAPSAEHEDVGICVIP